jgi:hypothetical protein
VRSLESSRQPTTINSGIFDRSNSCRLFRRTTRAIPLSFTSCAETASTGGHALCPVPRQVMHLPLMHTALIRSTSRRVAPDTPRSERASSAGPVGLQSIHRPPLLAASQLLLGQHCWDSLPHRRHSPEMHFEPSQQPVTPNWQDSPSREQSDLHIKQREPQRQGALASAQVRGAAQPWPGSQETPWGGGEGGHRQPDNHRQPDENYKGDSRNHFGGRQIARSGAFIVVF